MIKLFASVCIEAPAESVWAQLAKLEDIQLWSEPVLHARCTGAVAQGVGAERVCELAGNTTITERWVAWDEGRSFTYEGSGIPLLGPLMRRMAPNALAGFKYLVEHGYPYDGKASELPRVPATC